MNRIEFAIQSIQASRHYTKMVLDKVDTSDWFRMPAEGVTHIGWQVGHIAVAEFRLSLQRVRGPREDDDQVLPPEYVPLFGKGSTPSPDASKNPHASEILQVLDRVHERVLQDIPLITESTLNEISEPPHPIATTKYEALLSCARHEIVHTGQIALLRRLLGHAPAW